MVTLEGFMDPVPDGSRLRISPAQKRLVEKAAKHMVRCGFKGDGGIVSMIKENLVRVMEECFTEYPTDRSCFTCDYHQEGYCKNNGHAEIPEEFREQGCDSWQDDGAPF